MNQLRFAANPDTNYVFHMLSVAKVGYDNAYGERFRGAYPAEDLAVLKSYEDMLTVRGGEHCGVLHYMMVSLPACAEQSAKSTTSPCWTRPSTAPFHRKPKYTGPSWPTSVG